MKIKLTSKDVRKALFQYVRDELAVEPLWLVALGQEPGPSIGLGRVLAQDYAIIEGSFIVPEIPKNKD